MSIKVTPIPISVDPARLVPNNNKAVMFFVEACPTGWSEYTALRGRYTVGVPSGGDITDTVGTALTNKEDRQTGQHNHTFSGTALGTHNHVQDPHDHTIRNDGSDGASSSIVRRGNTVGSDDDGAIGDTTPTNQAITAGTPAGTIANTGSVTSTNSPYVQLMPCTKD